MLRMVLVAGALFSALAFAQTNPADEWGNFPVDPNGSATPPPRTLPPPPPLPVPRLLLPAPGSGAPRSGVDAGDRPPDEPNTVTMYGAPTLGQWKRGQTIFLGFPLLGLRAAIGLLDRLDFYVGFESFYAAMNEFSAGLKVSIFHSGHWSLSGGLEGLLALFTQKASKEVRGARWITAHRNYGLSPGLTVSFQGESPRAARLFLELRYLLAFDTEPFARDPLNGVPPGLLLGHNLTLHFGAEMPLGTRTSFVFLLGMDFHGRQEDAVVMPVALLGLVTGF